MGIISYLMNASLYYPREMIVSLAKNEPQEIRKMFEILFDEERPVNERASVFNETADRLQSRYKGMCFRRNYQTMNAISTYLWLKYPDRYYFYKYSVGKAVSSATGKYYADLRDSEVDKMTKEFALLDQISEALRKDNRFINCSRRDWMRRSIMMNRCIVWRWIFLFSLGRVIRTENERRSSTE